MQDDALGGFDTALKLARQTLELEADAAIRIKRFPKPRSMWEALLGAATLAALDMADDLKLDTMAIPAISAGVYGYPADEATAVIAKSAAEYLSDDETTLRGVRLVGFDTKMASRFARAIRSLPIGNDRPAS